MKYIPENIKEENIKFYKTTQRAYYFGLSHILVLIGFYVIGIREMVLFNAIVSIPSFVIAIIINRLGKHNIAFAIGFFELFVHQVLATYFVGWEAGMQLFLIYLAGLSFFNPTWKRTIQIFLLGLILLAFILLYIYCKQGLYQLSDEFLKFSFIISSISSISSLAILINGYSRSSYRAEEKLKTVNLELKEKNEEITAQRDEINSKKEKIEYQNTQIISSIQYAERIQKAVLPEDKNFKELFPSHFILNKPRNIVSGDFYWIKQIHNFVYVTVADCTGHGVPGAFMSMLGTAFLNEITGQGEVLAPSEILNQLREKIKKSLRQKGIRGETSDGMDMALIRIDLKSKELIFSGAYNPLIHLRKDNGSNQIVITKLKGERMPIGISVKERDFKDQKFQILPQDTIYMFSDGYADQFGGTQYKKYMMDNLLNNLKDIYSKPLKEQKDILDEKIEEWKGNNEQTDDILVMGIRFDDTYKNVELFEM